MAESLVRDWQNRLVPAAKPDEAVPHWVLKVPNGHEDYAVRGWAAFLDSLRGRFETALEAATEEELRDGLTFTVRLEDWAEADLDRGD